MAQFKGPASGFWDVDVDWSSMTACTGSESQVKIWALETGSITRTIDCDFMITQAVDVNWEQGIILAGSVDYQVKAFALYTGELLKVFKKPRRCITQVRIMK